MTIKLIATGGTFDKEYDEVKEKLIFKETHLPEILKRGRCKLRINLKKLFLIDSWDMNDSFRELILKECKKSKEDRIIITHGTSTIAETARFLKKHLKNKTIVLTGAMVPYTFGSSDGLFNLGSALGIVQALPKGVYVAMNGEYFNADDVKKVHEKGVFEKRK